MPKLTIAVGAVLCLIGVVTFAAVTGSSATALIPAFVGLPILVCGLLARRDKLRKHAIHAALAIALIGLLGSLMNVVKIGDLIAGTSDRPAAIVESILMFVVCAVFIAIGVRSFIAARRRTSA